MVFTLNAGEFDLGGGCIGRGTILAGEAYSNTNLQNLLDTAGLEGNAASSSYTFGVWLGSTGYAQGTANVILFRESGDPLTGAQTIDTNSVRAFFYDRNPSFLSNQSRYYLGFLVSTNWNENYWWGHLNSGAFVSPSSAALVNTHGEWVSTGFLSIFRSSNWRFLARDHATAITHYPSTATQGSIFAASCVNSSTQWGLWAAGAVGNRSGYFSQRQGDFAIVLLQNGANTYFSVMTSAANNSTTRNDSRLRSPNIIAAPGQSGDDRFSELLLFRDQGNGYSQQLGIVPGFIYVDMNRSENSALAVGDNLTIEPGSGTTYELNKGAIIVARWGLDISATISNVGSLFTVATISTPGSATLASGNRNRWILESNQRIRFTATPPTGLSVGVDYWIIGWDPVAFTFQLSATQNGTAIVPSSDTSSTITRFAALIAMPSYSEL